MDRKGLCPSFAFLAFLAVIAGVARGNDTGVCHGSSSIPCPQANLNCSPSFVFPLSAHHGFKASSSNCSVSTVQECQGSCCGVQTGDCLKPFSPSSLLNLVTKCWGNSQCLPTSVPSDSGGCNFTTRANASYVWYHYACVDESKMLNFSSTGPVENDTVVMQYTDTQAPGETFWSCHVESKDCNPRLATVFLYVIRSQAQQPCSTMSINDASMSCDAAAAFRDVTLPVRVNVSLLSSSNILSAWAVVRAEGGTDVRVWCGLNQTNSESASNCSGTLPSSASPTVEAPGAKTQDGKYLGAAVAGWVIAGLALASALFLLVLLLRRQGKWPHCPGILRRQNTAMLPLPDSGTQEAPYQATNPMAFVPPGSDGTEPREEAIRPSDNAYLDMESTSKNAAKGGNARQSSLPAKVVSEEEYSPLECQPQEGEMYSPLEVDDGGNVYQDMQTEEIYENA